METLDRREALKLFACGGFAGALGGTAAAATSDNVDHGSAFGMLYDSTLCIGCKACVPACTQANNLTPDTRLSNGLWQMPLDLNSETKNVIKLAKRVDDPEDPTQHAFFKHQCMHCLEPACAAGCPFNALYKDKHGVVRWDGSLCIGCRYCEVTCPYDVPKFEWDKFNPKIVKCELCFHRLEEGIEPGCTAACPTGAVIFSNRRELLEQAKGRLAADPERYFEQRVFGEFDGGGTQVLYLSGVPFTDLGLPELGPTSMAEWATRMHAILYKWMLLPIVVYAVLAAIIRKRWQDHQVEAEKIREETGLPEQL
jgi:Fe-S-cluster-containing dehydrogenase component